MCSQCETCLCAKFRRGACRGVMDCDPDEYWCSADNDEYYYMDDDEIKEEQVVDIIRQQQDLKGRELTEEEISEIEDDVENNFGCPNYSEADPWEYEDREDPDAYDRWKDEQYEEEN